MEIIGPEFYSRNEVIEIARDLLGKVLVSHSGGHFTSGIITETEAYRGTGDRASHAYNNKRTQRTEVMFGPPGFSYVYLCYGVHHLFNVVTNVEGIADAVLIRNIMPLMGIDEMRLRRGQKNARLKLTGPGTLTQAMGIDLKMNAVNLISDHLHLEDHYISIPAKSIYASPRVGVDYAGADAQLPYRFTTDIF